MTRRIAVDIDGTLNRIADEILRLGRHYFGRNPVFTGSTQDYQVSQLFGVTKEMEEKFWEEYSEELYLNSKVQPFAADVLMALKKAGFEITILTSRSHKKMKLEKLREITERWLWENNIVYNQVIFEQDKAGYCTINRIPFAVDDNPKLLLEYQAAGVKEIGIRWYHNKEMQNVRMVGNWIEVWDVLMGGQSENEKEGCEKNMGTTNLEKYENIIKSHRVTTSIRTWNPETHQDVPIDENNYDVIVNCVESGHYCKLYKVVKNVPGLSEQELALVCDEGNLCFGYDVRDGRIAVYTD